MIEASHNCAMHPGFTCAEWASYLVGLGELLKNGSK